MDQSSEQSGDGSMDRDDGRWLTYPELATVRGIDKPSAIRLATRKKWRRQRDNHRVVRVLVPPEWLSPRYQSMDRPMEQSRDRSADRSMEQRNWDMDQSSDRAAGLSAVLAAMEAAHAGEVAALHGQIAGLKTLADTATGQLADANAARVAAQERAERADAEITTLRDVVDGLRSTLARAESRAVSAEQRATQAEAEVSQQRIAAEQARAEAEEARRAAEVRIAGLETEASAQVAQAKGDAIRARGVAQDAVQAAEALQTAVDELKAGQGRELEEAQEARKAAEAHIATLEADATAKDGWIAQAEADRDVAQQAAAEFRRAEEARKGRRRWARLTAAWRGE
jgi:chromosome segregation ATPase